MRVLVIGLAGTGEAVVVDAARAQATTSPWSRTARRRRATRRARGDARALGAEVVERPTPADAASLVASADLVVPSPGVPPDHPAIAAALARERPGALGDRPRGRTLASARTRPGRRGHRHERQDDGHHADRGDARSRGRHGVAAGNIGRPLLDAVDDDVDVVVAEVSSFQLAFTTEAFAPRRRRAPQRRARTTSTGTAASRRTPRPRRACSRTSAPTSARRSTPTTRSSWRLAAAAPGRTVACSTERRDDADFAVARRHDRRPRRPRRTARRACRASARCRQRARGGRGGARRRRTACGDRRDPRRLDEPAAPRRSWSASMVGCDLSTTRRRRTRTRPRACSTASSPSCCSPVGATRASTSVPSARTRHHVRAVVAIGEAAPEVEAVFGGLVPVVRAASMHDAVRARRTSSRAGRRRAALAGVRVVRLVRELRRARRRLRRRGPSLRRERQRVTAVTAPSWTERRPPSCAARHADERAGRRRRCCSPCTVAVLNVVGVVMVLSASSVASLTDYGSSWYFFDRQLALDGARARRLRRRRPARLPQLAPLRAAAARRERGAARGRADSRRRRSRRRARDAGSAPASCGSSRARSPSSRCSSLPPTSLTRRAADIGDWRRVVSPVLVVLGGVLLPRDAPSPTSTRRVVLGADRRHGAGRGAARARGTSPRSGSAPSRSHAARDRGAVPARAHVHVPRPVRPTTTNTGYQIAQSLIALGSGGSTASGSARAGPSGCSCPTRTPTSSSRSSARSSGCSAALLVLGLFAVFAVLGHPRPQRTRPTGSALLLAAGITAWIVGQAVINLGAVVRPAAGLRDPAAVRVVRRLVARVHDGRRWESSPTSPAKGDATRTARVDAGVADHRWRHRRPRVPGAGARRRARRAGHAPVRRSASSARPAGSRRPRCPRRASRSTCCPAAGCSQSRAARA